MGYSLTEPMTGSPAEGASARFSALQKKKGLGAPFLQAILSTKYCDDDLGLYYYGYRWFSPGLGRWLSRDPIGEDGGWNLLHFALNAPVYNVDWKGLFVFGKTGPYTSGPDQNRPGYTSHQIKGKWDIKRPGDGTPCECETEATADPKRNDDVPNLTSINLKIDLTFNTDEYKELIIIWKTCYRAHNQSDYVMECDNKTECRIDTGVTRRYWDTLVTTVRIAYLSCVEGVWETKTDSGMKIYEPSIPWGWTKMKTVPPEVAFP